MWRSNDQGQTWHRRDSCPAWPHGDYIESEFRGDKEFVYCRFLGLRDKAEALLKAVYDIE